MENNQLEVVANKAILETHGVKFEVISSVVEQARREIAQIVSSAKALTVTTVDDYNAGGELKKQLKGIEKRVGNGIDPMAQRFHQAHGAIVALKKSLLSDISTESGQIDRKMSAWRAEQERIRREAEIAAQREATRLAEEQRLQEAERLEASGETEAAEQLLNEEVRPTPVVLGSMIPKVEGVSVRTIWKFRIVNKELIPREFMTPDEKAIGGVVRAMKDKTQIPGVEVYPEEIQATRTS